MLFSYEIFQQTRRQSQLLSVQEVGLRAGGEWKSFGKNCYQECSRQTKKKKGKRKKIKELSQCSGEYM